MQTNSPKPSIQAAVLHGGGYVGMWMIELLLRHPEVSLKWVTSRSGAGRPIHSVHPTLFGKTDLLFSAPEAVDYNELDVVFITAEHKQGVYVVMNLLEKGYNGKIIDLSADFRFQNASLYSTWFGYEHPAPDVLPLFQYGLVEIYEAQIRESRYVANPGCFATALNLALYPLSRSLPETHFHITAMTGASGSGNKASAGTHFPNRSGNVRTYKVLNHQHQPEILQTCGVETMFSFVPVSGPWTYGIWASIQFSAEVTKKQLDEWYLEAYGNQPGIRLWPSLPELLPVVGTPFCDLGTAAGKREGVVVVAIDNLWKGASSQAIQNMNLMTGLPVMKGLL
ncbi:MAG: N-acetyl-gamma-glutamyl-phosphate reductase [Bacteroidetes Order II. Incertae sedis bacterium]|nr:N-acetyl-gamma-glutamyl-phosphate reductase [Bacteroidetes Order II. bacterium]